MLKTRILFACVLCLAGPGLAGAQTVKLAWDPPTDSSVAGYVVYYGAVPGSYHGSVDAGTQTEYSITNLPVGQIYYFTARSYNSDRTMSDAATEVSTVVLSDYMLFSNDFQVSPPLAAPPPGAVPFDYDGDGRADLSIFRPSTGRWHVLSGANHTPWATVTFGQSGDVPLSADFDGDRKMDPAVFRPSTGRWYFLTSTSNYGVIQNYAWGYATDVPLTADFDGDGRADLVIYRPTTGMWYVLRSATGYTEWWTRKWGIDLTALPADYTGDGTPDKPAVADYDGDGAADYAVYRPSRGVWFVLFSSTGYATSASYKWGLDTTFLPADYVGDGLPDTAVPADYDGDGRADISVFRKSIGVWHTLLSTTGFQQWSSIKWGMAGDVPVPGDYNGDRVSDIAVFRPSIGTWFFYTTGSSVQWGLPADLPIPRR
jgi:hypothetical protein